MSEQTSENMQIYEKARKVPDEAIKPINGGRLKGMSDINPMWRIKTLTELFGPCGFGWKIEIVDKRLERGCGDEIACFVDINLYVKWNGEWSEAIPGTGGSMFITKEKHGNYTSDECYKMALTDAISVACKHLGFAADIYYANDRTKYTAKQEESDDQDQNGSSDIDEIELASKLLAVLNKWKVLSGEKDDKKAEESFNAFLKKKGKDMQSITIKDLETIESMLAKKLVEKNRQKKLEGEKDSA